MDCCFRQGWVARLCCTAIYLLLISSPLAAGIFPAPVNATVSGADVIASGDFNGDGHVDLVVADGSSSTVSVLLGNGSGAVTSLVSSTSGVSSPASIVVGDFNGDGHLDVALHNKFDLKIVVLLGNGDGSFQAPIKTLTNTATRLVAGDFNGDGRLDLASGNQIFLGKGDGTFQSPTTVGYAGTFHAAADFNGDGSLDLVGNDGTGFSVFLGNGDGTFQSARSVSANATIRSLAVADMNNDKHADVVVAADQLSGSQVMVFTGNGDGSFAGGVITPTSVRGAYEIAVGDFTGDGYKDVAISAGISQPVALLAGTSSGALQTEKLLPMGFAEKTAGHSLIAVDFDASGVPDLAGPSGISTRVQVWMARAGGGFDTATLYPYAGTVVVSADFNGDARPDVLFASTSQGVVGVMLSQSDGTLAAPVYTTLGSAPIAGMVTADLNLDGHTDLVYWTSSYTLNGTSYNGSTYAALGNGDGSFQTPVVVTQSLASQAIVRDLNGDGYPDVADLDAGPGNVAVFLGKGDGSFGYEVGYPGGSGELSLDVGDANGDLHPDLVTAGSTGVNLLSNNGDGTFAYYSSVTTTASVWAGLADVDNDGKLDVVAISGSGSAAVATVYLGSGKGTFTKATQFAVSGVTRLKFADINNDGLLDVIADEGSATGVWLNVGSGSFAHGQELALGGPLATADVNTDGLPDLVQVSSTRNYLTLAFNQFGTSDAGDYTITATPSSPTVTAGDKTTITLTLNSLSGYAGIVTLGCTGLPVESSCTFSPANVTIPGASTTASVTIQTSLNSVNAALRVPLPPHGHAGWPAAGLALCGVVLGAGVARGRRARAALLVTVSATAALFAASCASPSAVPPIVPSNPITVTKTVTITATAGKTVRSTQVNLTITK